MQFLHTFQLYDFIDTLISLLTAFVFGTLIGAERQYRQRSAGLRTNVLVSVGAAAFVDAGQVSADSMPFSGTLRVGAGIGARYYTPIGPVRLDFAVPLNRPPHGDRFELYLGLGQAF